MGKNAKSILAGVGIVLLFLLIYLFVYKGQVSAPTGEEVKTEQESTTASAPDFKGNEEALQNALNLYIQKKQEGVDMTSGPCLGKVAEDWVLDIAHNPRQEVDDKEENQCEDYLQGRVKHYIELDPDGRLINSK